MNLRKMWKFNWRGYDWCVWFGYYSDDEIDVALNGDEDPADYVWRRFGPLRYRIRYQEMETVKTTKRYRVTMSDGSVQYIEKVTTHEEPTGLQRSKVK